MDILGEILKQVLEGAAQQQQQGHWMHHGGQHVHVQFR
jgi:hypothetical protein